MLLVNGLTEIATGASTLTTPSVVVSIPADPSASASTGFRSCTARLPVAVGDNETEITAITPLEIAVELRPVKRHVFELQEIDLPAAEAAAPTEVLTDAIWGVGKFRDHWSPCVSPEVPGVNESVKLTFPPAETFAEESWSWLFAP
jgi:hypothetical protein